VADNTLGRATRATQGGRMKVEVIWHYGAHRVRLTQSHQQFYLDYEGSEEEAKWMAKMFLRALAEHDLEKG
jgi:hypothetical protein